MFRIIGQVGGQLDPYSPQAGRTNCNQQSGYSLAAIVQVADAGFNEILAW
jgi:hypothetical protein